MTSLLYKLIDHDPRRPMMDSEKYRDPNELQKLIVEDLQNMLGTRSVCLTWNLEHTEITNSVINFGIPDVSGLTFSTSSLIRILKQTVELAIARFEPRLSNVSVAIDVDSTSHSAQIVVTADTPREETGQQLAILTQLGRFENTMLKGDD